MNTKSLENISRSIQRSQGEGSLHFVRCNYKDLRERMIEKLQQICPDLQIQKIVLPKDTENLYKAIKTELQGKRPSALMVFGLESVNDVDKVLKSTKQDREKLSRDFPFPVFLWLTEAILSGLVIQSPDFVNWAAAPIKFEMTKDELINLIQETTDEVFEQVEKADSGKLFRQINVRNPYLKFELESAKEDLNRREIKLDPKLEASLEFGLGIAKHECYRKSLQHYKNSLKFYRQSSDLVRRGCLLVCLGRWYRNFVDRSIDNKKYRKACCQCSFYYKRCIKAFEDANRQDYGS